MRRRSIPLAVALALAAGCAEDFEPYSRLSSLRVLAVRSEPAAPASGETTTLDALVYTPPGVAVVSRAWSWCPFPGAASAGYPCLVTEAELEELSGGQVDVPSFDLGGGETATLENSIDPALLAMVCEGAEDQPELVDCEGGFPAQVRLVVRTADQEVIAVRTLRLRFAPEHEPNANPTLDGIAVMVGGGEQPLGEPPGPTLVRREETQVLIDVPEPASEPYTGEDDAGEPATLQERIIVSWFVESGDVDDERTAFIDGLTELPDALKNTWEPDDVGDYPRDTADLYVVVRDNRDGVVWGRGTVTLTEVAP